MTERYLHQSPLAPLKLAARAVADPGEAGIALCERRPAVQLALRGRDEAGFRAAVGAVLGVAPPAEPNRVSEGAGIRILWLGPDEWLVVAAAGGEGALAKRLIEELAGQVSAVTDVSEARAVIGLAGREARALLSQGCSLDLHPRVFQPGHCAQSLFARVPILLHLRDEDTQRGPGYDIYLQRSLAEYLWHRLEDAAQAYGLAIVDA